MRPEEGCPLVPRGFGGPKFPEDAQNKFLANEDENAYVQLEVFGDPAPKAQWFRVSSGFEADWDLSDPSYTRYKFWCDGKNGFVFLGVENCTKADEGIYRCVITNRFGKKEHKFKLFISRSYARKAPLKREVQVYWAESPKAVFIKQGTGVNQVVFTAKLTVSDKSVKWSFQDQVLHEGAKYGMSQAGGTFTLAIRDPNPLDTGRYKCVLANLEEISCETYLDVQPPDPVYFFLKPLQPVVNGYSGRPLELRCLCAEDAPVTWEKEGREINEADPAYVVSMKEGEQRLEIVQPLLTDTATFSCRILKFGKEGEEETHTRVNITEFPHKFAKHLVAKRDIMERETLSLLAHTEEQFAIVKWFRDGKELLVERKRGNRLKVTRSDTMHMLTLEKTTVADAGLYTARTNYDFTECNVGIREFPFRFEKRLPKQTIVNEDGRAVFEVEVMDEEAVVKWFSNNVEIEADNNRNARIQVQDNGKSRVLSVRKCTVDESARIVARTNVDESASELIVKCQNIFLQRLVERTQCNEHCTIDFVVKVKDRTAPVNFFIDKFPLDKQCDRYEFLNNGKGEHTFRILKVSKSDSGVLSCKTPTNRNTEDEISKCIFDVMEGESPPLIGKVEPVSCVAILHSYSERMNKTILKEACKIVVPYKILGTPVSTLDILVEKDGHELEMGNNSEINMKVRTDRVTIDIGNPIRSNSGVYKLTLSNDQGSAEVRVPVEVLDVPSPPQAVTVSDVRKDSVLVSWKPPADSGGTPIKHYIMEASDYTTNNMWTSVGMTEDGEATQLSILHLAEGHRYSFRVIGANKVGQSEPQEMMQADAVTTKDPWEVPKPPGKASVLDWTPTFVDLAWPLPESDGGSPITSYIIEVRETSMRAWVENTTVDLKDLETLESGLVRGRCENLQEEYQYRFRIVAVNRAGKSAPGTSSESVTAMHKNIPPFIKGNTLEDNDLKEGKQFRFDVWVGGEPVPTIEWFRNDTKVLGDDQMNINVYTKSSSAYTLKNAVLSVPKAVEGDHDGVYKLRLKNESGVFEAVSKVKIDGSLGKRMKEEEEKRVRMEKERKEIEERVKLEKAMKEERERLEREEKQRLAKAKLDQERLHLDHILSKLELEANDEDKDSGMKIGEDSAEGSEYEEYTEDEDFYDEDETALENKANDSANTKQENQSSHTITNGDIELEVEGDKSEGDGVQRRTSDYTDSLDSQPLRTDDEGGEREGTLLNCEREVLENAKNFSNGPNMLEGGETAQENSNYIGDEVNIQKLSHAKLDFEDVTNSLKLEKAVDTSSHQSESRPQDGHSDSAVTEAFEPADNSDSIGVLNGYSSSVQDYYGTSTAGQGWYDDAVETDEKDLDEVEANSSSVQDYYGTKSSGMGWYDGVPDEAPTTEKEQLEIMSSVEEWNSVAAQPTYLDDTGDNCDQTENKEAYVNAVVEIEVGPEPELFNAEQHLTELQETLDSHLLVSGFTRSVTVVQPELVTGGDGCLVSLLDQMNREGQDFKVWERDDFSFLRWYVTKQMESLMAKVSNLKFTEAVEGNVQDYIDHVAEDGVYLDKNFLQAVATIFNKDIVLVAEGGKPIVVAGGIDGRHGKGIPLYLAHIQAQEGKNKDVFISIIPDIQQEEQILCEGDSIQIEALPEHQGYIDEVVEEATVGTSGFQGKWKRMDSYNPRDSKDMDQLIQDMEATESYREDVQAITEVEESLAGEEEEKCSNDLGQASIADDFGCYGNTTDEADISADMSNDLLDTNGYVPSYATPTVGMGWYDNVSEDATTEVATQDYVVADKAGEEDCVYEDTATEVATEEHLVAEKAVEDDAEEEESCEGWVFDSATGYWIECSEEAEESLAVPNDDAAETLSVHDEADNTDVNSSKEAEKSHDPTGQNKNYSEDVYSSSCEQMLLVSSSGHAQTEQEDEEQSISTNTLPDIIEEVAGIDNDNATINQTEELCQEDQLENGAGDVQEDIVGGVIETSEHDGYDEPNLEPELNTINSEEDIIDVFIQNASDTNNNSHVEEEHLVHSGCRTGDCRICGSRRISRIVEPMLTPAAELIDAVGAEQAEQVRETTEEGEATVDVSSWDTVRADSMTSGHSCETALDENEGRTSSQEQRQGTKIVRKIKIKVKVNNGSDDQVTPCSSDPVDSESSLLSVPYTHTDPNAPVISESVSGVTETALELSETSQQTENTKENTNNSRQNTKETKCKTIPDVCVDLPVVTEATPSDMTINSDGDPSNCPGQVGSTHTVTSNGLTAQVKMRAPLRKYSSKKTASYRWSGTEMLQLEGERTNSCPSPVPFAEPKSPEICRKDLEATREKIAYKKTYSALSKKSERLGFTQSKSWDAENAKTGDNCLRALIDQICQPWQDFKVWDREDHGFLRWYLAKQVEIQVAGGRASHFLRGEAQANPKEFIEKMAQDEQYMNNDFLFSTARVLNKDIFLVASPGCEEEVVVFRGGPGGGPGKGLPLVLGHLAGDEAGGKDYYQSLQVQEGANLKTALDILEQRS